MRPDGAFARCKMGRKMVLTPVMYRHRAARMARLEGVLNEVGFACEVQKNSGFRKKVVCWHWPLRPGLQQPGKHPACLKAACRPGRNLRGCRHRRPPPGTPAAGGARR